MKIFWPGLLFALTLLPSNALSEGVGGRFVEQIAARRAADQLPAFELSVQLTEIAELAASRLLDGDNAAGFLDRRMRQTHYHRGVWSYATLYLVPGDDPFTYWPQLRQETWRRIAVGHEYEELGIGWQQNDQRLAVVVVAARSRLSFSREAAEAYDDLGALRQALLDSANRRRLRKRRLALRPDDRLSAAAQNHAAQLAAAGRYDHRGTDGSDAGDRARAAGYVYSQIGENLAKGLFTPDEVIDRWMKSSGHRKNLLHRELTEIGHGVAYRLQDDGELEVVWVQLIARPR